MHNFKAHIVDLDRFQVNKTKILGSHPRTHEQKILKALKHPQTFSKTPKTFLWTDRTTRQNTWWASDYGQMGYKKDMLMPFMFRLYFYICA